MDWETFLGVAAIIIMMLGIFIYNFRAHLKLESLYNELLDVARTNQRILQISQLTLIAEEAEIEKMREELKKLAEQKNMKQSVNDDYEPRFWSKIQEYIRISSWFK